MTHTDIKQDGWIDRLPRFAKPYALLMRLDRPVGTWLLLLPGWWGIALASGGFTQMTWHAWKAMALFGIGAVLMRGAGCVINDLWDRDLDKGVGRTASRPLAAGTVGTKQAFAFLAVLLGLSFLILIQLPLVAICLGFLSIPFIAVYPLMKRITWWPQAFLGLTFNFGALMGWAAIDNAVALPCFVLYAAGILWTLGYDTIYAHQDIEDDARMGIRSSARALGQWNRWAVAGFYVSCWILLQAAFALAGASPAGRIALVLPLLHMAWQLKIWDRSDPGSALFVFRSNRDFGLMVLIAALLP